MRDTGRPRSVSRALSVPCTGVHRSRADSTRLRDRRGVPGRRAFDRGGDDARRRTRGLDRWRARIERHRRAAPERPCHNDLLNVNFIDDGGPDSGIVDWEYAGMGDVVLRSRELLRQPRADADTRHALLEAYFGAARDEHVRALELMRFMSDFREAMWGVVQSAVSELDFDFDGYAAEHFGRMVRTADEPAFRDALESG